MRAFCYFVMVRTWGDLPLVDAPTLTYDPLAVQKERTPKAQIFTFIKSDLDAALGLYPDNTFLQTGSTGQKQLHSHLKDRSIFGPARRRMEERLILLLLSLRFRKWEVQM